MGLVCGAAPGVVVVDLFDINKVIRQVHGYRGRVSNLVDRAHCKVLYSVFNREPTQGLKMVMVQVGPGL